MGCGQCTAAKLPPAAPMPESDRNYEIGKAFCLRELRVLPSRETYRKRLLKWHKMLQTYKLAESPLLKFRREKAEIFGRRLEKGPPVEYRWQAWLAAMDYTGDTLEFTRLMYGQLSPQVEEDIAKDVSRTFPDHAYLAGDKGRNALTRVLKAFALQHTDIGYCQGLNYVAAFLLFVSGGNDAEAFFVMTSVVKMFSLKGFYISRFPGLWKMIAQFNAVLEKRNPTLFNHLHQENAYEMSWVGPWMLSLYTTALPFPVVIRIWDLMLAQGLEVLIKTALRLVDLYKGPLKKADLQSISEIFSGLRIASIHIEDFVRDILKIELDDALMMAGAQSYEANLTDSARASLAVPASPVVVEYQGNEKCPSIPIENSD